MNKIHLLWLSIS